MLAPGQGLVVPGLGPEPSLGPEPGLGLHKRQESSYPPTQS
tara:strand:- start:246 stop:368 length:123 start_codon:yes stop_codon:yes gene_type:complete